MFWRRVLMIMLEYFSSWNHFSNVLNISSVSPFCFFAGVAVSLKKPALLSLQTLTNDWQKIFTDQNLKLKFHSSFKFKFKSDFNPNLNDLWINCFPTNQIDFRFDFSSFLCLNRVVTQNNFRQPIRFLVSKYVNSFVGFPLIHTERSVFWN